MLNNKKATEMWAPGSMPFFIIFTIALGFSILIFFIIANSFVFRSLEMPKNVEESILIERFYNSPECFAYKDDNDRVYQKVIDWNKFTDKGSMNKCLSLVNYKYAFKLELEGLENYEKKSISTSNWIEGANFRLEQKDVFVYSTNKIKNRRLSIFIQNV